jgi:hypothetical protein
LQGRMEGSALTHPRQGPLRGSPGAVPRRKFVPSPSRETPAPDGSGPRGRGCAAKTAALPERSLLALPAYIFSGRET